MTIRFTVQFTVAPENMSTFQELVREITTIVRDKERNRTLCYEFCALESGSRSFVLNEAYADADAFIAHFGNLGERAAVAQKVYQIERMIVSGKLPDAVARQLKAMGPHVYLYAEAVSSVTG